MLTSKHIVINGGLAQSEECVVCNDEAPRSKLGFSIWWSYSVMVITLDFESSDPGSNPGRTSFFTLKSSVKKYSEIEPDSLESTKDFKS